LNYHPATTFKKFGKFAYVRILNAVSDGGLSRLVVFHVLSIHPYLLEDGVDPDFFPKERFRATLGIILYAIAGVTVWLSTPKLALLIFLGLPVFYGITSEGLTETRIRLQFGRAHRRALAKDGTLANSLDDELRAE
jgi:hypothetical protein